MLIHAGLSPAAAAASRRSRFKIAPLNLLAALSIVAAGIVGGPGRWVLWRIAVLSFGLSLGGGAALIFVGDALFRRTLEIGQVRSQLAAAALALVTIPLGTETAAVAQLATLFAFVVVCLSVEWRSRVPASVG